MRLAGKRVLITGTAGGQGEAAQAMFAREGAHVVGCDVQEGAAERTAAELRDKGYEVTGHTVDLSDADAARSWVDEAAVGDELRAFQLGMHLIQRPGLGDDIAYLAVYLASDESAWVTGQNISADGGVTAGFR
jgi:NAD(P)-dependent dehydrogenase (short-subunit alcohol dehydrogenase family)